MVQKYQTKYFATSGYNKHTGKMLHAEIKEKRLADKSDIAGFIDNSYLDKKITTLATKAELNYFRDKSHFEDDGRQNYSVF